MKKKLINKLQFAIDDNIYDVIKQIKLLSKYTNKTPIAFIKNRFGQCVGTLTLSDFYRVKKKKNLIIRNVMNKKFIFINKFYSENLILRKFENFFLRGDPNIKTIPVLNKNKIIIDLINFEDFQKKKSLTNSNKKPKIKFVSVKIPARLSFSGGGTDFSNLINENKIYVISSSIDKYIKVEINILKKKISIFIN